MICHSLQIIDISPDPCNGCPIKLLTYKADFIGRLDKCFIDLCFSPVGGGIDSHIVPHAVLLMVLQLLFFPDLIKTSFLCRKK